jgi:regulator of sigma E protease
MHSFLHTLFVDARVVILFAIVLGIMVLIHEFGHFAVAKLCGVRIEVFSIGFGKRLFGYTAKNGTDYRIAALPLGGYVKMAGELGGDPGSYVVSGSATGAPDEFNSKTRFQRILIALAGPAANFVLSFFLLALAGHYHHEVDQYLNGPAVVDYVPANTPASQIGLAIGDVVTHFGTADNPTWEQVLDESALNLNQTLPITFTHNGAPRSAELPIHTDANGELSLEAFASMGIIPQMQAGPLGVSSVSAGTPADRAGLKVGDEIESFDTLHPHSVQTLHAYLMDRSGAPTTVVVKRNGQLVTLNMIPELVNVDAKTKQYQIGFLPKATPVDIVQLPIGQAIKQSIKDNKAKSLLLVRILQGLFTRHVSVKQMSGPVGIAQQIDLAFQIGPWSLVEMTSFISINLAIFNLLPFPPLDGGMIFFLLIESIIRRDVNQQLKERVYQIAFVCIICMFVFVMFNDISRLHLGR